MNITGNKINSILNIGAIHALYSIDGTWYHQLKKFPGVLFDNSGYFLVLTKELYDSNRLLKKNKDLHIKDGISKIPGYKLFTAEQQKLLTTLSPQTKAKAPRTHTPFTFKPSGSYQLIKVVRNQKSLSDSKEIKQIHREICEGLYRHLVSEFDKKNISCDCPTGNGTYADMIRKDSKTYHLYEIKSYNDIRRSVREALGQLLEYAFWNFNVKLGELIIVSHKPSTELLNQYLLNLRTKFSLPVYYQQFDLRNKCLLPKISFADG